jgi:peptidoglycan/xylan/chitin deacetylase (PgdA/CDA1 family)
MSELNRRGFLGSLAAATLAGVGVAHYTLRAAPRTYAVSAPTPVTASPVADHISPVAVQPDTGLLPPPPRAARVALPGGGMLNSVPGTDVLALTVDDGVSTDVVRLYTEFARDTGVRLTYFVNGTYPSWTEHLELLRPLVDAGQIQLANHTWSHPDLTTVSKSTVAQQIGRNEQFLRKNYGVDPGPYLRPPYGRHNAAVDAAAADLGYTAITTWSGSLADSTVVTEDYIVKMARQYFISRAIVIGHLNHVPVTHVYPQLVAIIRERNLRTVTLDDVYLRPEDPAAPSAGAPPRPPDR